MNLKFTEHGDRIFTGLMLATIAGLLALSGALIRFDNVLYDWGQRSGFTPAPADIVIIAIDEASLNKIGHWPWSLGVHTTLLNKLSVESPQVVGLDLMFALQDKDNNQLLNNAIARAGNVVVPLQIQVPYAGASVRQVMSDASLAGSAAAIGRDHAVLDEDGVARSVYLWEGVSADGLYAVGLPHFSQSVLQVANQFPAGFRVNHPNLQASKSATSKSGYVANRLISFDKRKVHFLGPPGHFQSISYAKVLAGDYPASHFKNKIVLVGITAAGLGHTYVTPTSTASLPMSGVEYHANVIASMRSGKLVSDAPRWLTCLVSILLAILPLAWLHQLAPRKSLLLIAMYVFVVTSMAIILMQVLHLWVPPAAAMLAILLAYPIWRWRRLDSAQLFLDKELQHLRDELAALGMEQENESEVLGVDSMQARISRVKLTAKHLRDMHRSRSDTLAFISHDIRAPLGAAMMLLSEFEDNKHADRMKRMLGRAYSMAEGFLQASKAEMVNVNKFHALDMVSIVQQAVDDIYELAKVKQLKFAMVLPEDSLWIRGDFGLLLRAITNILINAINYSPTGATIKVRLKHDQHLLTLEISDQGPGIPAARISKLFRRFSRVDAEHQSREGSGLGLYFVDVTMKKHHGDVSVKSQLGVGTTFVISMPLERRRDNQPVEHDRRAAPKPSFWDTL